MTKTSALELLFPIWQRVLQRPSIQVTDNFFALGGDPASAAQLFAEIGRVCGRYLSPLLIYSAPTIEALAALLENPDPPRIPPLVLLKPGNQMPPIFIAPGLGGTVFDLFHLVERIVCRQPMYGMQARGLDGMDDPLTSVEAMAQFQLEAIKQLQPQGPYFLIGYSLGGLVALEIAQRLSVGGEKVALLALLDAYPHRTQLGLIQKMLLSFRLVKRRIWSPSSSASGRTQSRFSESKSGNAVRTNQAKSMGGVAERMRGSAYLALKRYRPQFYRDEIKFVRADISTEFPDNPTAVWSHLAEKVSVETIAGDHWSMLAKQYERLGSTLTRYVREAQTERPNSGATVF
jgi:thioesterase domain-containing protein